MSVCALLDHTIVGGRTLRARSKPSLHRGSRVAINEQRVQQSQSQKRQPARATEEEDAANTNHHETHILLTPTSTTSTPVSPATNSSGGSSPPSRAILKSGQTEPPPPSQVAETSCHQCHRAHRSCDRNKDGCSKCANLGKTCTYPVASTPVKSSPRRAVGGKRSRAKRDADTAATETINPIMTQQPQQPKLISAPTPLDDDDNPILASASKRSRRSDSPKVATSPRVATMNPPPSITPTRFLPLRTSAVPKWRCENSACGRMCDTQIQLRSGVCSHCRTPKGHTQPPSPVTERKIEHFFRPTTITTTNTHSNTITANTTNMQTHMIAPIERSTSAQSVILASTPSDPHMDDDTHDTSNAVYASLPPLPRAPSDHFSCELLASDRAVTIQLVRTNSSIVAEQASTPRLIPEDEEHGEDEEEEEEKEEQNHDSDDGIIQPTPSDPKIDADVEMKSTNEHDDAHDDEEEELFSLSQPNASLDRTFSSAATPIHMCPVDGVDVVDPASVVGGVELPSDSDALLDSPVIVPMPYEPPHTPTSPTKVLTPKRNGRARNGVASGSGSASSRARRRSPRTPSPASAPPKRRDPSPIKLLQRADATVANQSNDADMQDDTPAASAAGVPVKAGRKKAGNSLAPPPPAHTNAHTPIAQTPSATGSKASSSSYALADMSTISCAIEPSSSSSPFHVSASAATCCGFYRKLNQDTMLCMTLRHIRSYRPMSLFAVFDGHGVLGDVAAEMCKRELPAILTMHLTNGMEVEAALENTIADINQHLVVQAHMIRNVAQSMAPVAQSVPPPPPSAGSNDVRRASSRGAQGHAAPTSPPKPTGGLYGADYGTTAIIAVLHEASLTIANVGDSRCMVLQRDFHPPSPVGQSHLSRCDLDSSPTVDSTPGDSQQDAPWNIVFLSDEHNGDIASERARVESEGGRCHYINGEFRMHPATMTFHQARTQQLTINMTRSLGHIKLGGHGISPIPHIRTIQLADTTENIIVLGSDGIYDVLSPPVIRDIVTRQQSDLNQLVGSLLHLSDHHWQLKKHGDNITAVVARVKPNIRTTP